MLTNRNGKLGKTIWAWNLPAYDTCPGATPTCAAVCYAAKVERIYKNAAAAYAANLETSQRPTFAADIVAQIKRQNISTVRIHADGDFYSVDYILDWHAIAAACPKTVFFAYTRSWRVAGLLPALESLRALPNVRILASVDVDTPEGPKGWRMARMLDKHESKAAKATGRPGHRAGLICPEQTGKADSCGTCKVCFNPKAMSTVNFILH